MKKIILVCVLVGISWFSYAKAPVFAQRVEPLSWWVGMANPELQIMLYGPQISACEVSFANNALPITRIEKPENPNYLFVYVNTLGASASTYQLVLKKGKKKQVVNYELHERRHESALRASYNASDVVYLIMPDRFANGDESNDQVAGYYQGADSTSLDQRQGGDIQGVINHLDYLAELGVTTIWPTPFLEDNDLAYSYHHYACTDYYKVDPRFGSNADYRRLAQECHHRGLKLIMDIVPNHCGGQHWWMKDLPSADWVSQWDTFTRTNYQVNVWTDPHASTDDLNLLSNGWFDTNMPDLNLKNPYLFDYLRQAFIYWIEYADLDGLRVDTYPYNNIWDGARLMASLRHEYPNLTLVGECWVKSPAEAAYYQSGVKNKDGYNSQLQSVMDFTLKDYFESAFRETNAWNTGVVRFYSHFAQDFVYDNSNLVMNMIDNHDMNRLSAVLNFDAQLYKMAFATLLTVRGYPQLYYGDEIMMDGKVGRYEDARYCFPGGWKNATHNAFNPETRTKEEYEMYNYFKSLLHFRKQTPALHNGKMTQFIPRDGIYVYFRTDAKNTVMVVMNNNTEPTDLEVARFDEMNIIGKTGIDVVTQTPFLMNNYITIPAKTVLVLDVK